MPVTLATSMRTSNKSYFKCPWEPSRLQNCSLQAQLRPASPLTDEPRSQSGNWSGDPGGFCHDICSWSDFQRSDDPTIIPVISAATGEGGGRFFYRGSSLCVLARNSRLLLMQWKPCGSLVPPPTSGCVSLSKITLSKHTKPWLTCTFQSRARDRRCWSTTRNHFPPDFHLNLWWLSSYSKPYMSEFCT